MQRRGDDVVELAQVAREFNTMTERLDESLEARLVTTTGRLLAKPNKTAGGDITLVIERDGATPVKVMADPSSRITTASMPSCSARPPATPETIPKTAPSPSFTP